MPTSSLTPAERTLRARIAAYERAAQYDGAEVTAKARDTFRRSFEQVVDPLGLLPEDERKRRAEAAFKAHMARLSFQAAKARREKKKGQR